MNTKLQAAAQCLVSIDDNAQTVTVRVPANFKPSPTIIRQWHATAGDLGYGIRIEVAQ